VGARKVFDKLVVKNHSHTYVH